MAEQKQLYQWTEFAHDAEKIAVWAKQSGFKNIYGIPRGGLILAVLLSHRLDLPVILSADDISPATLVVDDISDTGKTLETLERRVGFKPKVATIFYQADTSRMPDFSLREKKNWIVFPWETKVSSKYDGTAT